MPNPALTPDERRIVEWLRSIDWTNLHRLAATSFADAIESLAHRKAEDAAYRFWSDDQ